MEMVVIAKLLAELSIFYVMFGYLSAVFGLSHVMYIPYILMIAIGAISWRLSKLKGKLGLIRLFPLLLLIPVYIWQIETDVDLICLIPPTLYLVITVIAKRFETNHTAYFKFMYKGAAMILLPFVFSVAMPASIDAWELTTPFVIVYITSSLVVLRTLRHEKGTYDRVSFKLANISLVCAAFVISLIFGNKSVQSFLGKAFNWFVGLITVKERPNGNMHNVWPDISGESVTPGITLAPGVTPGDTTPTIEPTGTPLPHMTPFPEPGEPIPTWILATFGVFIVLAIIAAMLMFKSKNKENQYNISRSSIKAEAGAQKGTLAKRLMKMFAHSNNDRVRRQYQRFLKHVAASTGRIYPGYNTKQILDVATEVGYNERLCVQLRNLYLPIRYCDGHLATNSEVSASKRLVDDILKRKAQHDAMQNQQRYNS